MIFMQILWDIKEHNKMEAGYKTTRSTMVGRNVENLKMFKVVNADKILMNNKKWRNFVVMVMDHNCF